ncbi:MAG: cupin domain-containing protein [Bacillota bacterium]
MTHFNLENLNAVVNKRGVRMRTVITHEHATVKNLLLEAGDVIPFHQVEVDVFFFIIEGEGTLTIGEESVEVKPKDIVMCPPNTPMSVEADKGESLSFLNVKTPGIE